MNRIDTPRLQGPTDFHLPTKEINQNTAIILESEIIKDGDKTNKIMEIFRNNIEILEKQNISIEILQSENEILTKSNDDLLIEMDKSASEHRKLADECSNFKVTLQDVIQKKAMLELQMKQLVQKNISFSSKNEELMEKVSALTRDLTSLSEEFNKIISEKNTLKHKFDVLDQENRQLRKEHEKLTADQAKSKEDLTLLENEKNDFQTRLDEIRIREAKRSIQYSLTQDLALRTLYFSSLFAVGFTIPIGLLAGGGFILLHTRGGAEKFAIELDKRIEEISKSNPPIPRPVIYEKAAELTKNAGFNEGLNLFVSGCEYTYNILKEKKCF